MAIKSIKDLTPDPRNANRGTERGAGMLERSLRNYGAGRSILADKNGVVIAGNKTLEQAAALGLPIEVVETDGRTLVVVQRKDLDLAKDKAAKELAIADNRVGQISLDFDPIVLDELAKEIDLSQFFGKRELENLHEGTAGHGMAEDQSGNLIETFSVLVECNTEKEQVALLQRLEDEGYKCRSLIS